MSRFAGGLCVRRSGRVGRRALSGGRALMVKRGVYTYGVWADVVGDAKMVKLSMILMPVVR